MIVVIGSPTGRRVAGAITGAGIGVSVARSAAAAGAPVQLVGKVGDGPDGDAVLLSLASVGVGHIAVLRDATTPAVVDVDAVEPDLVGASDEVLEAEDATPRARPADPSPGLAGPALDAADLTLALRYLPDYQVVVAAEPLEATARAAVVEAARWAGARLVLLTPAGEPPPADLPEDATVFELPGADAESAFASMVGRYAAALDAGSTPATAFDAATSGAGATWERAERS